jgi:hypothetical protein
LALVKGDYFWGKVTVVFGLKKMPTKNLFLDFRGISIGNLKINGTEVKDVNSFYDHKI